MDEIERLSRELEQLQIRNKEEEQKLIKRIREKAKSLQKNTEQQQDRETSDQACPKDRHGAHVVVGARVTLLTKGLFHGDAGTVTKLGKQRATITLDSKKTTTRKYQNIRVEDKHDE